MQVCITAIFSTDQDYTTHIPKVEKAFGLLEGILPESGFINGLESPTVADLVVLFLFFSYLPIGSFAKHANFDLSKYPKGVALAKRVQEVTGYESETMGQTAFGK
jgi:hypothetical protein